MNLLERSDQTGELSPQKKSELILTVISELLSQPASPNTLLTNNTQNSNFPTISDNTRLSYTESQQEQESCKNCSEKICRPSCYKSKLLLPGVTSGRGHNEFTTDDFDKYVMKDPSHSVDKIIDLDTPKNIIRQQRIEIFETYKKCLECFSGEEWVAVTYHYNNGLNHTEIGKELGKARSTISGLLKTARLKKEEYFKNLRKEAHKNISKNFEK